MKKLAKKIIATCLVLMLLSISFAIIPTKVEAANNNESYTFIRRPRISKITATKAKELTLTIKDDTGIKNLSVKNLTSGDMIYQGNEEDMTETIAERNCGKIADKKIKEFEVKIPATLIKKGKTIKCEFYAEDKNGASRRVVFTVKRYTDTDAKKYGKYFTTNLAPRIEKFLVENNTLKMEVNDANGFKEISVDDVYGQNGTSVKSDNETSLIKDKTEKEIKGKYKFTTNFKMNKITTQKGYAKMIIVLQDGKGLKYTEVVYIKYSSAK